MRQLKIKADTETENLSVNEFDNKQIANMAKQYSKKQTELDELYAFGVVKYEELCSRFEMNLFESDINWSLRQEMVKYSKKNFTA